jgi:hypothetical protein
MKGDFCRMCGSKKLRQQKRDIFIESQKKMGQSRPNLDL